MARRLTLAQRSLPNYCRGEEIMNMVTHIVGAGIGLIILILCVCKSAIRSNVCGIIGASVYGASMVALYTVSSIYHGLYPSTGKKVMQVLDHCTIYLLIAGTYTPLMLCSFIPAHPVIGWGLLSMEWILAAVAATLTAIDLRAYRVFSMVCYICMGWGILPFLTLAVNVLSVPGFLLLLYGGIAYTLGAILFGIGTKIQWIHSVFHIFVVIGSILQFLSIFLYVL